jgi:xylulokinase
MSLAHGRAHLTRAVLEGVCFALRDSVSILSGVGVRLDNLLLTGGGAKSPFVRRLQADVYGIPVSTVDREEGPAYGAALLGAVGAGAFPDLASAVQATVRRSAPELPDPSVRAAYDEAYARFKASYHAAHPMPVAANSLETTDSWSVPA